MYAGKYFTRTRTRDKHNGLKKYDYPRAKTESDYPSRDARVLIQRALFFCRFTPLSAIASLSRVLTGLLRTFYCSLQIISGEQPAIGDARGLLKRTRAIIKGRRLARDIQPRARFN